MELGVAVATVIDGHQLRIAEALSDIYTAERRLQAARWELDDRLAAAHSDGHNQDELGEWLGLSQQAISTRLERRRRRLAAASAPQQHAAADREGDPHG